MEGAAHVGTDLLAGLDADLGALHLLGLLLDVVGEDEFDFVPDEIGFDLDIEAAVGVFHEIGEEVVEEPLHRGNIHADQDALGDVVLEIDAVAVAGGLCHMLHQQLLEQDPAVHQFHVALGFFAAEHQKIAEELVGELLQLKSLLPAGSDVAAAFLLGVELAAFDDVQVADQGSQRRADIVRHGSDELGVGIPGFPLVIHPLDQGVPHAVHTGGQVADLVVVSHVDRQVQIALRDLLHLFRELPDPPDDQRVIDQYDEQKEHSRDDHVEDIHGVVPADLLCDLDEHVVPAIRKTHDPVVEIRLEPVRPDAPLRRVRVCRVCFVVEGGGLAVLRDGGSVAAVQHKACRIDVVLVIVHDELRVVLLLQPCVQFLGVGGLHVVLLNVGRQRIIGVVRQALLGAFRQVEVLGHVFFQHGQPKKSPDGDHRGCQYYHDHLEVEGKEPTPGQPPQHLVHSTQCDNPFPTRS